MKTPSKPFAELVTRYRSDDFFRARITLSMLYTIVMTIVIISFSIFLFVRVEQQLVILTSNVNNQSSQFISKEEALAIAQSHHPQAEITDTEEESLNDNLVYVVEMYQDEQEFDIYIDRVTGQILSLADGAKEVESFNDTLINDFEENLLLANLVVLLMTVFLSYFLAGLTLRPIQKKMLQQEQFSLDVAHEIRTPLSAIMAATDSVLAKEEAVQTYQETLRDIKKEASRLNRLTEDLLATAKNVHPTEFTKVDLSKAIHSVIDRLAIQAHKKNVRLDFVTDQSFLTFGNKTMLERMLENVLHNAVKFSHDGGTVKITLRDRMICIADTGIGISPENKIHIFERFYTADSSRNECNKDGTGLGLSIVKQIADLHKITIKVDSEQSRGTVIQFSFLQ